MLRSSLHVALRHPGRFPELWLLEFLSWINLYDFQCFFQLGSLFSRNADSPSWPSTDPLISLVKSKVQLLSASSVPSQLSSRAVRPSLSKLRSARMSKISSATSTEAVANEDSGVNQLIDESHPEGLLRVYLAGQHRKSTEISA